MIFPSPTSPFLSAVLPVPNRIYDNLNSYQRLFDTLEHICLPLLAIMYGSLAAQARLSRTAALSDASKLCQHGLG